MSGNKVLITGVTSGIGRAVANRFAKAGYDIVGHYRSSVEEAEALSGSIKSGYGVECSLIRADFNSEAEVMDFLESIEGLSIDTLVNNAGTYVESRHFSELSLDELSAAFMVNTFVPLMISSRLFVRMKEKGYGRIVNISSIAAKYGGSALSMHYGCSKRALEGITKTLAKEGAEYNVLVNTIRPGVIDTDFHKRFPKDMEKRISMIPVKRMGTPGDIAEIAHFLGSGLNNFITNEIVAVAGGE
jgi:NAD(P)-dependent dehydrogenase (short-subunit alcohol dehydrogenase family)